MHPSEVYSFSPISRVGFLMTTFGSSDDTLSPAFGRISILKLPGFFFDLFNLGIWRYKIQIFIGSGSEIKTESLSETYPGLTLTEIECLPVLKIIGG